MDKNELIERICQINRGAKIEFLSKFSQEDLKAYLEHLVDVEQEELAVCS